MAMRCELESSNQGPLQMLIFTLPTAPFDRKSDVLSRFRDFCPKSLSDCVNVRVYSSEQDMTDSQRLLAEYAANGSEPAFRELVSRYIDLVYSASVRLVDGDTHLAQDVAQTVFVDLARKADTLSSEVMLGGWLHRHTCFVAAKALRSERRRQFRERQAAQMNALNDHTEANLAQIRPFLDEAINRLGAEDRTAILLRFFEQSDFRSIGRALGTSDDTAQKRVTRALEKLHSLLKRRGIACSSTLLGTALAGEAVTAAPVGLAVSISGAALAGTAAGTGTTLTLVKIMAATNLKIGIAGALIAISVVTPFIVQQRANARLRSDGESLRRQADQLTELQAEHERLERQAADASLDRDQLAALQRLRGEVGELRQQTNSLARLRQDNRRLRAAVDKPKTPMQVKEEIMAKASYNKDWLVAFYQYAEKNQGQFPANFDQAAALLSEETRSRTGLTTDQFEIVFQGSPAVLKEPQNVIVVREREAWTSGSADDPNAKWSKVYGFADGHVEVHSQIGKDFEAYEKLRLVPRPSDEP